MKQKEYKIKFDEKMKRAEKELMEERDIGFALALLAVAILAVIPFIM